MFRPVGCNALDLEFRPGKPLSTEIRRRIVDLYERDRGKSQQQFVLLMAECVASFVIIAELSRARSARAAEHHG